MNDTPQHTYQVLTKRAERLYEIHHLLNWTKNIWMGVSINDDQRKILSKMADETVSFVSKALDHANNNPQFAPAYVDVKALAQNVQSVTDNTG